MRKAVDLSSTPFITSFTVPEMAMTVSTKMMINLTKVSRLMNYQQLMLFKDFRIQ